MGIEYGTACLLISWSAGIGSSSDKVDFSRTLTLGRQSFCLKKSEYEKLLENLELSPTQKTQFYEDLQNSAQPHSPNQKYCEPFFKLLQNDRGGIVDSIDYSDFENATIIHDLTIPIKSELKNKYTCVYDGGLLEHVYDYPIALKNAMDMVAIDGHLILITPGNNAFGHGFYQFSPELFYSVLRNENGFDNTQVYTTKSNKWYLVQNPRLIHRRVDVSPNWSNAYLYVVSTKVGEVPDSISVYQSDYEDKWASRQYDFKKKGALESALTNIYHSLPSNAAKRLLNMYSKLFYKKRFHRYFTLVDFKIKR